ncbi:keratin, type I cytoskeletal 42-like [Brachyhypopomus gauderio]|uniref:keratin, type I cytoskeletal 42-like n=1 Tax=Brachyhypopomus gauderio TaxID=698409 RepID=UPI004041BBE3
MPVQYFSSHSLSRVVGLKEASTSSMSLSYGRYDTRKSHPSAVVEAACDFVFDSEKMVMQNLNNRLASYLDKVRSLEAANSTLELKIKEWYESRRPACSKDLSLYYSTIEELRKQIYACTNENATLWLQMDNTEIAKMDFKKKFEDEINVRVGVEAEVAQLRRDLQTNQHDCKNLKLQISSLEEELVFLKKNHEEEMQLYRTQQGSAVDVQVDCASAVPLNEELDAIRTHYEALIEKSRKDAEVWFQSKVNVWKSQVTNSSAEVRTSQTAVNNLRKKYQQMEIELESILIQKQVLEKSEVEVEMCFSGQLNQLQAQIHVLQEEIQELKDSMQNQGSEYQLLLDVKMRLELEIAEYRRLLGEEGVTVMDTVKIEETKEVVKIVERFPHVQRRVKVTVEKLVDGQVVSVEENEQLEEVSS